MKLLILTAIIAAVTSSPVIEGQAWPWQVGKLYRYDVDSYTLSTFEEGINRGNMFKTQFIIRVKAPGRLLAKLETPLYSTSDQFKPVEKIDEPFEIYVDGGRILSINLPPSIALSHENLIKGLVSALQVDLSSHGLIPGLSNSYDEVSYQGLFKKMEADVTGDCETLYTVSPLAAEWRRELPKFSEEEDPIEIVKSKNYGSCQKRVNFYVGVPEGAVWNGIANRNDQKQFIKHTYTGRVLAGKQGAIYKADVMSSVSVAPLSFGKQKAGVHSAISFKLNAIEEDNIAEWQFPQKSYVSKSLLFTLSESVFNVGSGESSIASAQNFLLDIAPNLQNLNSLPDNEFLSKFNNLVRLIAMMNSEQLDKLSKNLEEGEFDHKDTMRAIYRDAVAQAGSEAAFHQVKSWIMAKKIQEHEAAQVLMSVAGSLLYPSNQVLEEFFDFALCSEVVEQKYLNTSALLAAAKVIRIGQYDKFLVEKVIPRLSKELHQAIKNNDSAKAQVYIRVLGNFDHPAVLKAFVPYLEGHIVVTKYLRIQMVASLKRLANTRNEYVRDVLYSILKNSAETYEVRVAAALNLFLAFPTADMMRNMAFMTNYDISTQVRAVLATSISFAAKLKDPRFAELALTAQSVMDIISKEKFGYRYSTDSLIDLYTGDDNVAFFRELSFIGSKDFILPTYQRSALRSGSPVWNEESSFTFAVSGWQQLFDYLANAAAVGRTEDPKVDFKYSAKKILELLNIKRDPLDPVEASFYVDNLNYEALYTFSEENLRPLIMGMYGYGKKLSEGVDFKYFKILNQKQMSVIFPLAVGMPFVYDYSEPVLLKADGNLRVREMYNDVNLKLDATFARNLDGRVGFIDTLGNLYASAGVISKLQLNLPINISASVEMNDFRLLTIASGFPEQNVNIMHFSVSPYTAEQKIDSLLSVLADPSTKLVESSSELFTQNVAVGGWTGMAFNVVGETYSKDYKNINDLFGEDDLENWLNLMYPKDIALTRFNIDYDSKATKNKDLNIKMSYKYLYNQNVDGEMGPAPSTNDVTLSRDARCEKAIKQSASGIKNANVIVADVNAVFDGKQKTVFVLTGALANSYVDPKVQGGLYFYTNETNTNAVFKMIKPKVYPLNLNEALANELKVQYEADVKLGGKFNVLLKGIGERTANYTAQLRNAIPYLQEIDKRNLYQLDYHKMLIKAHAPDMFKGTVTFKDLTLSQIGMIFDATKQLHKKTWDVEKNSEQIVADDSIEFNIQAFYLDNYVNYEFTTKEVVLKMNNVEGMHYDAYAMSLYSPISSWERTRNWFTDYQNLPYCAIDYSKIRTFSGRSYEYGLSSSWHVVMVDEAWHTFPFNLVILARRSNDKLEAYISYMNPADKYVEVEIKPEAVEVKSNMNKTCDGVLTTYLEDVFFSPLLEYYSLADGVTVFNIWDKDMRIIYDGQRLIIFTDSHRSRTRGVCGQSTTQISDDYLTPWGLVSLPEHYGASFSLEGEFSDPKTVELKKEAKLKAYPSVTKYTKVLSYDADWGKSSNRSFKGL